MGECLILKQGGGVASDELTATTAQVLNGYTAVTKDSDDDIGTGTMANRGAVNQSLSAGSSYTIPQGYHNGNGKVTANSLASQTLANAVAANMTSGKTAWVNGKLVTGNGADNQTFYDNGYDAGFEVGKTALIIQGANGNSETKKLLKGTYKLIYESAVYSHEDRCPIVSVYVNGAARLQERNIILHGSTDDSEYSLAAGIKDLVLSSDSNVYLNISSPGQYYPYATAVLIRTA